jgi:hypothetical protein
VAACGLGRHVIDSESGKLSGCCVGSLECTDAFSNDEILSEMLAALLHGVVQVQSRVTNTSNLL